MMSRRQSKSPAARSTSNTAHTCSARGIPQKPGAEARGSPGSRRGLCEILDTPSCAKLKWDPYNAAQDRRLACPQFNPYWTAGTAVLLHHSSGRRGIARALPGFVGEQSRVAGEVGPAVGVGPGGDPLGGFGEPAGAGGIEGP